MEYCDILTLACVNLNYFIIVAKAMQRRVSLYHQSDSCMFSVILIIIYIVQCNLLFYCSVSTGICHLHEQLTGEWIASSPLFTHLVNSPSLHFEQPFCVARHYQVIVVTLIL